MRNFLFLFITAVTIGCSSKKKIVYFQDIDETALAQIDSVIKQPTIDVNDILTINISALDVTSLEPFLLKTSGLNAGQQYIVDKSGNIQFPILGTISVKHKSIPDLQVELHDSLANYLVDPIVQVQIVNFKFTVLGAVSSPGTFQIEEEGLNLLQAIGMAGDFTINGKRENVLLIRQINGQRSTFRIDFTQSDWLNSELFYLKQNDVLYIEPNFAEVKSAGLIADLNELLRIVTVSLPIYILLTTP